MVPLLEPSLQKYVKQSKGEHTVLKLISQLLLPKTFFVDCVRLPIALFPQHSLQTGRVTLTQSHEQATCVIVRFQHSNYLACKLLQKVVLSA